MTIKALSTNLSGDTVRPESKHDWDDWVSASRTRNYVLENALVDWLELYGEEKGYEKDVVDDRADFVGIIMSQGQVFERYVLKHLQKVSEVETIWSGDYAGRYDISTSEQTFDAMARGVPIIYQGTLRDAESKTYGSPDFLFRSDIVNELFPNTLSDEESQRTALDLPDASWHYVVVDSKFANLDLLSKSGELGNGESSRAYKVQVYLYNRMLARLQGYSPPHAFLLGRGWKQRVAGESLSSSSSMDRLGPVNCKPEDTEGRQVANLADSAVNWVRSLRIDGSTWVVEPEPSIDELRVNAAGEAGYWSGAVKSIIKETEDLTVLYHVSSKKRNLANKSGFTRWSDPLLSPDDVGLTGESLKPRLAAFLEVNRKDGEFLVLPDRIRAERLVWQPKPKLEFFVDFETVNSLKDTFAHFPEQSGQDLIFMIGCGHIENGKWQFECFITERLTESKEASIIDQWFEHMDAVQTRLDPGNKANIYHWSAAEVNFLQKSSNSAYNRHPDNNWPDPNWFDFLQRVMREEPVVVRGAHGFGLKAITKALNKLNLIDIDWPDGTTDGLGAMAGAWWCDEQAELQGNSLTDYELMEDIRAYNEIDCKAMHEIISYMRIKH